MDAWSVDADSLWVRRTAMLAQLRHAEHTDTDLLERVLVANLDDTAYGKEFFVRKALGWALRQHAQDGSRRGSGPSSGPTPTG